MDSQASVEDCSWSSSSLPDSHQRKQKAHLMNVAKAFARDEHCLAYLEQMRWPEGVARIDQPDWFRQV
jgi:hypothetical protein